MFFFFYLEFWVWKNTYAYNPSKNVSLFQNIKQIIRTSLIFNIKLHKKKRKNLFVNIFCIQYKEMRAFPKRFPKSISCLFAQLTDRESIIWKMNQFFRNAKNVEANGTKVDCFRIFWKIKKFFFLQKIHWLFKSHKENWFFGI